MSHTVELQRGPGILVSTSTDAPSARRTRFPLYLQVLAGFVAGGTLGIVFGTDRVLFNIDTAELGELGMLVIRLLKTLAIPLVLFAIVHAILKTPVSGRQGRKLL